MNGATTAVATLAAVAVGIAIVRRRRALVLPLGPWQAVKDINLARTAPLEFWHRLEAAMHPPDMIECAIGFRPKAKDVVTLTTPKTGQTWLLAQLRMLSIGKVSIDENQLAFNMTGSGDGVPWLEHSASGKLVDHPQPGRFRVFKSHLKLQQAREMVLASPDARFITCLRCPHDVCLSFFNHIRAMWAKRCNGGDASPFDAAYDASMFALAGLPADYERNLLEWVELRHMPNVLVMWYEEMVADPLAAMRQLAAFVQVELSPELEASILKTTDYQSMAASPAFVNVFPGGGKYGRGRASLSAEAVAEVDARWQAVARATGCASYEALYSSMHDGAPFPFLHNR